MDRVCSVPRLYVEICPVCLSQNVVESIRGRAHFLESKTESSSAAQMKTAVAEETAASAMD